MSLVKGQTVEFTVDRRRYLLVYLGEHPFDNHDNQDLCKQCNISFMSQVLPHVHMLGELPVPRYDDPDANGASYGDYLRWLVADHVVVGTTRLAAVPCAVADEIIGQFRAAELERRTIEMRERAAG